ncbi:MAG: right-handed parallel beta-helix repeat-containing protein [Planctomycetota bacterium]
MPRFACRFAFVCCCLFAAASLSGQELPELQVASDDTVVDHSCRLTIAPGLVIHDANANGVIQVRGDNLTIEFADGSVLRGAADGAPGDSLTGIGVRVSGSRGVKLHKLKVSGFKVGVFASQAPQLEIHRAELQGNFRQRLRSMPTAEDGADWLWPHNNDHNEYLLQYGAALYIEDSREVIVRRTRVRDSQNGIIFDRVSHSLVYDCDASFLSGWGLAMWRSCDNNITCNYFDFCVRGYSHGVYNRGQDSAGILMFEQCSRNVIARNSAVCCGDGLFAFAGREALGEIQPASGAVVDYHRLGCNANLIVENDFSFAAAHGLELTFSFDNRILQNQFDGNAICGIWGGYSQDMFICANVFHANGEQGVGPERGGVNIEHGCNNVIHDNKFLRNKVGVHLWDDDDAGLLEKPWAKANHRGSVDNRVSFNLFHGDKIALEVRDSRSTKFSDNKLVEVGQEMSVVGGEAPVVSSGGDVSWHLPEYSLKGKQQPGAQLWRRRVAELSRAHIIMTEWGPWDFASPLVRPVVVSGAAHRFEVHGVESKIETFGVGDGVEYSLATSALPGVPHALDVRATRPGVTPYQVRIVASNFEQVVRGTLLNIEWRVRVFPWRQDPREDLSAWLKEADGPDAHISTVNQVRFQFGGGGPRAVGLCEASRAAGPEGDRFGTIATARVPLASGKWRIVTMSDDGVRVSVDGKRVIDNWTWHAPTRDVGEFHVESAREVELRVEHFELDGHALLTLEIEPIRE